MIKKKKVVICPSCGKKGFLIKRWVESQYYPQFVSLDVQMLEYYQEQVKKNPNNTLLQFRLKIFQEKVKKGIKYRGPIKKFLIKTEEENTNNKKDWYRVTYNRYFYYYICHYDKETYNKNMERYRKGELKSRPNGRKCHKLKENDYQESYDKKGRKEIIIKKGMRNKY